MALPVIEFPKHTVTLPVSKKEVTFRPFLVKELKVLMQAIELGEAKQVNSAIDDVLKACTFNEVNIDELPIADVEWLVLQLRAKSIREVVELLFTCKNTIKDEETGEERVCNSRIPVMLDLSTVEVKEFPEHEDVIMFTESIGVKMRDVPYGVYKKALENGAKLEDNLMVRNSAIEAVFDGDRVWTRDEFTDEELDQFLENLFSTDYEKIENYIKTMPVLEKTLHLKCPTCGHEEEYTLVGLDDFLD